jgi:S1-C subfamily serine protease
MHWLALLILLPGQIDIVDAPAFSRPLQTSAVAATVRVVNVSTGVEGSGALIAQKDGFAYVLTAQHLAGKGDHLEVSTFSATSYPRPEKVYKVAEVVAGTKGMQDLALVRLTTKDKMPGILKVCPKAAIPDQKGFEALAVGCNRAGVPTCLVDKVLGGKRVRRGVKGGTAYFWELSRAHAAGKSGGPLVDRRGYLLGVLSGTNKGKSYFCHTREIHAFLKQAGLE